MGHWEGDTLVVDVTNLKGGKFADEMWSDAAHVVERWTRPDAQTLEYQNVVEDPKILTRPWIGPKVRRGRLPYDISQENYCRQDETLTRINNEQREAVAKKAVVK